MGCVSSTTYNGENAPQRNLKPIPRQPRKSVNEMTKGKGIPIVEYIPPLDSGLSKIYLRSLLELQTPHILPCDVSLDMLWHLSCFTNSLRPNWSGFMTDVSVGDYRVHTCPVFPVFPVFGRSARFSCFCPVFGPYWCKNPVFLYFDKFLLFFPFLFFPKDSSKSCSYYSLCIFISLNNLDVLMQLHLSGSTYATIIYFP